MTKTAAGQASPDALLKDEILSMYQEAAENPKGTFHFFLRTRSR